MQECCQFETFIIRPLANPWFGGLLAASNGHCPSWRGPSRTLGLRSLDSHPGMNFPAGGHSHSFQDIFQHRPKPVDKLIKTLI